MFMEPERPIEKRLRAFAKKRRANAGAPLEPHPATRRMLQSEVARQFARPAANEARLAQVPATWWLRFAWTVPALIVLGLGAWSLVPTHNKSKPPIGLAENAPTASSASFDKFDQPALAYNDISRVEAGSESLGYDTEKLDFKKDRELEVAPAISEAETQTRREMTSTLVADTSAPEPGSSGGGQVTRKHTNAFTATGSLAAALPTSPADGAANKLADGFNRRTYNGAVSGNAGMLRQNFVQANAHGQFKAAAKPAEANQVLAAFQVEQSGNQLRVIDNDGSTYTGGVELAADEPVANPAAGQKEKAMLKAEGQVTTRTIAVISASNTQAAQNYFFRVAGTNRTLNQQVVFSGNFLEATNAPVAPMEANRWQNVGTPQVQPAAPMLLNSTINGRAQVGDQKEIQINAVPAAP